jgi:hypothetical protein
LLILRSNSGKSGPPSSFLFLPPLLLLAAVALLFSSCQPGAEKAQPPARLGEDVREVIRTTLVSLPEPVTLHFYKGGDGEKGVRETRAILQFAAETAPQISLLDHSLDPADGEGNPGSSLGVDHGPVVKIEGANEGALFFYGLPERKELKPFLNGILMASGHPVDLPAGAESFLSSLDQDVLIRIFTTPD